jgi:hypothetical protein
VVRVEMVGLEVVKFDMLGARMAGVGMVEVDVVVSFTNISVESVEYLAPCGFFDYFF